MTISTYTQLQSAVSWYANRDDLFPAITNFSPAAIDSGVQICIAMAETSVDRDINSRGGIKYSETVTNALTMTGGSETLTLPTDYRSVTSFMVTANPFKVLKFLTPNQLFGTYTSSTVTGIPEACAVVGTNTLYLRPVPDSSYPTRLIYKAALTPLSTSNPTNWLLTNAPQVYLGAAMVELAVMLENDGALVKWKGYYDQKMDDFMGDDRQTRWTGVNPTPQPFGAIA